MDPLSSLEYQYYVNHHKNSFVKYGKKCFSQTDEDGLTLEIVKRMKLLTNQVFLELGVGDGTECNTLILSALGWTGQWISQGKIKTSFKNYTDAFITKDNILDLINVNPDLLSIDLDGNDYYIIEKILTEYSPKIIITEYNALFPPPVEWIMPYDEQNMWQGNNYFGASLQSYVNLLANKYFLLVCNAASGGNAFFIEDNYFSLFLEVHGLSVENIYVPPRYNTLTGLHPKTIGTINLLL